MMRARVRFKDGTEKVTGYSGYFTPAQALAEAVGWAEISKGELHDGAWLEFED